MADGSLRNGDLLDPGAVIGIIGGGQLGRMTALAARYMGYRIAVLDPDPDSPCAQAADHVVAAPYGDRDAARELARQSDVLTYEFENVDADAAEAAGEITPLWPSGSVLRTADEPNNPPFLGRGAAGRVEVVDWDGTVLWDYVYAGPGYMGHNDVEPLPDGNVLMIAWELKSDAEAIAAGRDPTTMEDGMLWPDHLIELQPDGAGGATIVWEWHVWDHLIQDFDPAITATYGVVADHPELIDLNARKDDDMDWTHFNAVDYNAELDQILVSVRSFSEVWVIDHSTTTAEAAGHSGGRQGKGGDLLYRWGNPVMYQHGSAADRQSFFQHDGQWVGPGLPGAGNILLFNNGPRPGPQFYSTAHELTPPVDGFGAYAYTPGMAYEPALPTWVFQDSPPGAFWAQFLSGVQRLPNGNTLLCSGPNGRFFEVRPDGTKVWEYINPVTDLGRLVQGDTPPRWTFGTTNLLHRATRFAADHPAFAGRDLTPSGPLELYPLLRNADLTQLDPPSPALSAIFTGPGPVTLDPVRDELVRGFASGDSDPLDAAACAAPLLFYQVNRDSDELRAVKDGPCTVRIAY